MSYEREREETVFKLATLGWPLCDIRLLLRNASAAQRLAVAACNRELTTRERERGDRLESGFATIATRNGASARVEGDPRGYVVKLALRDGSYNTLGGLESGWAVPARES